MGFFGKLFNGISKAATVVSKAVSITAQKTVEAVLEAAEVAADLLVHATQKASEWAAKQLSSMTYKGGIIESRIAVEEALKNFRSEIKEQAMEAEETSICSAMSCFDEFANTLEDFFPELIALVQFRKTETKKMLTNTIINYVQEYISENNPQFQALLEMEPGEKKERAMRERIQSILDDAQDYFGDQLKEEIELLNDELNVRLDQKITAQENNLQYIEEKYKVLVEQESDKSLDIQKLEEGCVPVIEAASCIRLILKKEKKNEPMDRNRSPRPKICR